MENLEKLSSLRELNLANNRIQRFHGWQPNPSLEVAEMTIM